MNLRKIHHVLICGAVLASAFGALVQTSAYSSTLKGASVRQFNLDPATAAVIRTLPTPDGYVGVSRRSVSVDGKEAQLVRYERADGRNANFGGEHFSVVVENNGRLKGFARMDADLRSGTLPTRDEARAIAVAFLKESAPDLLKNYEEYWVESHDEPLNVAVQGGSREAKLTGMKVKMHNKTDGLWFWVIVGADRKVMVFERDIRWISFPGRRGTEKWLHDSWLIEKGYARRAA